MSNDHEKFETSDDIEPDTIDPEEPESWEPVLKRSPGIDVDEADWADQQVSVAESPFDDDRAG